VRGLPAREPPQLLLAGTPTRFKFMCKWASCGEPNQDSVRAARASLRSYERLRSFAEVAPGPDLSRIHEQTTRSRAYALSPYLERAYSTG